MTLRKMTLSLRLALRHSRLAQGAVLAAFWGLGELAARATHLPVPGGILGLIFVLILLASGTLRATSLRRGANWLLADMLLFFVPAVLAVLDHREFLGLLGLKLLATVLAGTLLVMGGTGLTVDLCCRLNARLVRHDE